MIRRHGSGYQIIRMMAPCVLVTGSCGLIGSEVVGIFRAPGLSSRRNRQQSSRGFLRAEGDTSWVLGRLRREIPGYRHEALDIRDREGVLALLDELRPDLIIHTAAQPSHDKAAAIPFLDFEVNALGTLHLLEAARQVLPGIALHPHVHQQGLWRPAQHHRAAGDGNALGLCRPRLSRTASPKISPSIRSKHSLFGASKVAADVMVQEYGRYFSMPTCCLRGGCLTGPNHSGVELHGFLSYLIKCNVEGREYKVFGYKGKQVRDNIHSEDVARFMFEFWKAPRVAEVYNLGGGKGNSCSILEAFRMAEEVTGRPMQLALRGREPHRRPYLLLQRPDARCRRITRHGTSPSRSPAIFRGDRRELDRNGSPPERGLMKILITGICGFAGTALAEACWNGAKACTSPVSTI